MHEVPTNNAWRGMNGKITFQEPLTIHADTSWLHAEFTRQNGRSRLAKREPCSRLSWAENRWNINYIASVQGLHETGYEEN